ncbi:MAG: hypothetical protein IJF44_05185 [Clostridia bacterium]|nr:hypothetical protein [Clostridia bacterium]
MKKFIGIISTVLAICFSVFSFIGCADEDKREGRYISNLDIVLKTYADKIAKAEEEKVYWEEKVDEAEKDLEEAESELESGYLYWEYEILKESK